MQNTLKYKKIMQSGRSMVEILGVLAVAGVLSIGAVSGYKYGMNKYRANETINELQVRAIGLMQQISRGEIVELNMEMGDKTKLGYTVDAWINEKDPKYFYIALENVPPAICKQILKEKWITPTAVYVGDNIYYGYNNSICGNDTYAPPMDFEFYRDFAVASEYVEGSYSYSYSDYYYTYSPEYTAPQQSCSDSDDPLGDIGGKCHACDTSSSVEVGSNGKCSEICPNRIKTGDYCYLKQCSADKPLQSYNGCYACNNTSQIYIGQDGQCSEVCSNRVKSPNGQYCVLPCSTDKPLMNTNGSCYACNSTANVYVGQDLQCSEICSNRVKSPSGYCSLACSADKPLVNSSGGCYACNNTSRIYVGPNGQCSEICPDRIKDSNGYCVLNCGEGTYANKPLRGNDGNCYACNDTTNIYVGENGKCNEICANRQLTQAGYCSVSQTCDETKPLQDNYGKCYACNATDPVYVTTRGKCEAVCSNRVMNSNGYCALPCSADKPLVNTQGKCYACNDTTNIEVGVNGECREICPNRQKESNNCRLGCPADKPLMSWGGSCYACNSTDKIDVEYSGLCSEICPNRQLGGWYCHNKTCPSDKPLMDSKGNCHACNTTEEVHIHRSTGPCKEICSNRQREGEYCVLLSCPADKPIKINNKCVAACPADKPLMDTQGQCHACDDTAGIYVSSKKCSEICSNRQLSGSYCYLKCPADKPLMNGSGTCYACDTTARIWLNSNQQCSEICSNRQIYNGYCIHSCGVGVYKTRPLTYVNGTCYTCDVQEPIFVNDGECEEVCANRTKRSDGMCYLDEEEE